MNTAILLQPNADMDLTATSESRNKKQATIVEKNMTIDFWLNFIFSCIEFVGGILTNSVTVISDAIHDLGDSMAIGLSLLLEKKSNKGATTTYTYGQRRFSVLAAFFTSLVLIIGSVYIVYEAIKRLFIIEKVHSEGVIWLAVLGIVFNGVAVLRLRKGNEQSLSQRSIMLHLIEDVLGWVAVLIGAIVMHYTQWFWIDPMLSLCIAGMILYNAIKNIRKSLRIFLQAVPEDFNRDELTSKLLTLKEVKEVNEVYCWSIDGEKYVLVLHITCSNEVNTAGLKARILNNVIDSGKIHSISIHIEN